MMTQEIKREAARREEIRLGVAGCGKHSVESHLKKLKGARDVSIAALYDPSREAVEELKKFCQAPVEVYHDEQALILSSVDAIFIMSPDKFHAETLLRAVRAGKHVFVEKPLAVDSPQLRIVADALRQAQEGKVVVTSCHARRFDPPFLWLKEQLPALIAELGAPLNFEFDFSYHQPSKAWKHGRGLLLDHANHEIDLLHWYFGHESFSAWRLMDSAVQYQAVGVRDDGIRFSFLGTRSLEVREYREKAALRFERGSIELDAHEGTAAIRNHESGEERLLNVGKTDYDRRFHMVNANFVAAINGTENNYLTVDDLYVNTAFCVHLTEQQSWRYERTAGHWEGGKQNAKKLLAV